MRPIGDGAMAGVHLARRLRPARRVALRRLRPGPAASPDLAARLLREADIAGTLGHPNLITVHEYPMDDGMPLGVVAHELLTGRLPFPMTAEGGVPQVPCRLEDHGLACRDGSGGWGFFRSRQTVSEPEPPTG
ncbi:MAG: hypothetical protein IT200_06110 [Thermoleophilia bacterium]|nr:hypothetical protein [Thermoleophilia bacterium]